MSDSFTVSMAEAGQWLEIYRNAWIGRDTELVLSLFTENATYRESRFLPAFIGRESIRRYWANNVVAGQRDIAFDFDLFAVRGPQAFTHWTAHFTWLPVNGIMELDGAAHYLHPRGGRRGARPHLRGVDRKARSLSHKREGRLAGGLGAYFFLPAGAAVGVSPAVASTLGFSFLGFLASLFERI
jgi:hypothetical protein